MKPWRIPRRTMLRGIGACLALPMLEVMTPLYARERKRAKSPLRMGFIYLPNGCPFSAWGAQTSGDRITSMNKNMKDFDALKDSLQLVTGLQSELHGSHPAAGATWLIRPAPEGDSLNFRKGLGGISVDQYAAKQIGQDTKFSSMELITRPEGNFEKDPLRNNISWSTPTTPVPRENEPLAIYNRITGKDGNMGAGKMTPNIQKSVLDTVLADARDLRRKVSVYDRDKLDEYLQSVRDVEKRLTKDRGDRQRSFPGIKAPRPGIPENHGEYLKLMFDMLVLALWTDSTRVCSFMLDHEQSNRYFDFIPGVKGMWHAMSHWGDISGRTEDDDGKTSWSSKEVKLKQYLTVIEYHNSIVAQFFKRLDSIKEEGGSLLDNSMFLYGSPFSDGHEHSSDNIPVMIAGKGGGKLKTGRQMKHQGKQFEGLFISMLDVMGVSVDEYGGADESIPI